MALKLTGAVMINLAGAQRTVALQLDISQLNFGDGPDQVVKNSDGAHLEAPRSMTLSRPRGSNAPSRTFANFAPNPNWPPYDLKDKRRRAQRGGRRDPLYAKNFIKAP